MTKNDGLVSGSEFMAGVDLAQLELAVAAEPETKAGRKETAKPEPQPIRGTFSDRFHAYGTKAQNGFEIIIVRVRDIEGRQSFAPVMRAYPKYKLTVETNRSGEIVIRHLRRKGLFRFENLSDVKEFPMSKKKGVCRKTLLWKNVTPLYPDLKAERGQVWEELFQELFAGFDEMWKLRSKERET